MRKPMIILLAAVPIAACSKGNPMSSLSDLTQINANLAFTCAHEAEHLPPLDPQADELFQYARYLQSVRRGTSRGRPRSPYTANSRMGWRPGR